MQVHTFYLQVAVSCYASYFAIKLGKPIFAINNGRSGSRYLIDNGIATPI
jgi:hypothetical protein